MSFHAEAVEMVARVAVSRSIVAPGIRLCRCDSSTKTPIPVCRDAARSGIRLYACMQCMAWAPSSMQQHQGADGARETTANEAAAIAPCEKH